MKRFSFFTTVSIILLFAAAAFSQNQKDYPCLAKKYPIDTLTFKIGDSSNQTTIGEELKRLGAICRDNKLFGQDNREIRFQTLKGCWRKSPSNLMRIITLQNTRLASLGKRFNLITLTYNPGGRPFPYI